MTFQSSSNAFGLIQLQSEYKDHTSESSHFRSETSQFMACDF